jgi:Pyruvate/2-oxoacid:ferredoxin oxidoreductase delta subunit
MNKKCYTLLLASLIFVACNTNQPTAKVQKKKEAVIVETTKEKLVEEKSIPKPKKSIKKEAVTIIGGVKFVDKSIIQEQGLLHIETFIGTLKPTLKSAMKDGGPTVGMGVCASIAMEMTDDYNALTTDTKIYRTALKYRNPKNKPDKTDTEVMNEFVRKGDFKPVTIDAGDHYRVYKPLATRAECLVCHGDSSYIPEKVSAMIKRKYPKDLAIDHVSGDFKGVVVAKISK